MEVYINKTRQTSDGLVHIRRYDSIWWLAVCGCDLMMSTEREEPETVTCLECLARVK